MAVNAITGILSLILFKTDLIFLYSGLKSWPHSLIQCASSTAKKEIFIDFKKSILVTFEKDSGARNKSFVFLLKTSFFTWLISLELNDEFNTCAILFSSEKPLIASTWFFIKAIKGEITTAVPSKINAGSW